MVTFDDRYCDVPGLLRLIRGADVVLLPYDSTEQVTSGVLVEALASGKPVVATAFPHAVELLSGGAGVVVGHRDPQALAAALRAVLTDPALRGRLTAAALQLAPSLFWSAVADRYVALATELEVPGLRIAARAAR
jgi:glycosyltransferase involved in cell wall biosynthesis